MAASYLDYDYAPKSPLTGYDNSSQNYPSESVESHSRRDHDGSADDIVAPYLLVHGLSMNMDAQSLKQEFEKYGGVMSCKIQSRGFYGYVNMISLDDAKKAVMDLNGKYLGDYGCAMQLRQAGPPPIRKPYSREKVGVYDPSWGRNRSGLHGKKVEKWQTTRQSYRNAHRYTKSRSRPYINSN
jgi:hypothetical protein